MIFFERSILNMGEMLEMLESMRALTLALSLGDGKALDRWSECGGFRHLGTYLSMVMAVITLSRVVRQ